MADFEIRQGDWGRLIQVRVRNADGSDVIVPVGTVIEFRMVSRSTGRIISGPGDTSNPAGLTTNNLFAYTTVEGDSDQVGLFDAEFVATYPMGAGVETFPTCGRGARGLVVEVCPKV